MNVTIIGGKGRMGRFLTEHWLWHQLAEQIVAIDKGDAISRVAEADIVVIAVPISAIPAVIASIKGLVRKDQLVFDIGSTKGSFINELRALPCRVASVHPLFGNHVNGFEGQNVAIMSDVGTTEDQELVSKLFPHAEISYVTTAAHDEGMKYSLCLPFLLRKVFLGVNKPGKVGALSTPSYRLFERYTRHVLEDPLEAKVVEEILGANNGMVQELLTEIKNHIRTIEGELR